LRQIPGIVIDKGLVLALKRLEIYVVEEAAIRVVKPGAAGDLRLVRQGGQKAHRRVHGHHLVERPPVEISLAEVSSKFFDFVKILPGRVAPSPSDTRHLPQSRGGVEKRLHDFFGQEYGLVIAWLDQKLPHRFGVAAPVRGKHGIERKTVKRLVVAKYAAKKLRRFFDFVTFRLIVNHPDPGADTGQCPDI